MAPIPIFVPEFHLFSGPFSEREGDYIFLWNTFYGYPPSYPSSDHFSLAGARTSNHKEGTFGRLDGVRLPGHQFFKQNVFNSRHHCDPSEIVTRSLLNESKHTFGVPPSELWR
jgi:hypothetical protein